MKLKKFRIYGFFTEYIVLKCPECGTVFRYNFMENRFGSKVKNAKCYHCEKMIDVEKNQLDKDPMFRPWQEFKEMILINPDDTQEFFKPTETKKIPELKEASQ